MPNVFKVKFHPKVKKLRPWVFIATYNACSKKSSSLRVKKFPYRPQLSLHAHRSSKTDFKFSYSHLVWKSYEAMKVRRLRNSLRKKKTKTQKVTHRMLLSMGVKDRCTWSPTVVMAWQKSLRRWNVERVWSWERGGVLIECRVALVQTLLGVKFCFISSATHTRARHTHIIEPHSFRRTHAHWHTMRVRDSGHTRFATSWVKLVRIFDWRISGTSLTIIGPCCFVSSPCSLAIFAKCWKREDGGKNLGENKDVNEKRRRASSC